MRRDSARTLLGQYMYHAKLHKAEAPPEDIHRLDIFEFFFGAPARNEMKISSEGQKQNSTRPQDATLQCRQPSSSLVAPRFQ